MSVVSNAQPPAVGSTPALCNGVFSPRKAQKLVFIFRKKSYVMLFLFVQLVYVADITVTLLSLFCRSCWFVGLLLVLDDCVKRIAVSK